MTKKRLRSPKAKPGQLKIEWGRADGSGPDVCVAWGPGPGAQQDGSMLMHAIIGKRLRHKFPEGGLEYGNSLIEELEARGYDISTLKISVEKKVLPNEPE